MKERVRLVVAMLLIRPLPAHVAAGAPAHVRRRIRLWTWIGYGYLLMGVGWLVAAALGGSGTPGWDQWLHWFIGADFVAISAVTFGTAFNARRGKQPRRTLRQ